MRVIQLAFVSLLVILLSKTSPGRVATNVIMLRRLVSASTDRGNSLVKPITHPNDTSAIATPPTGLVQPSLTMPSGASPYMRGLLALQLGDADSARIAFEQALAVPPERNLEWYALGVAYWSQGRTDDALNAWSRSEAGRLFLNLAKRCAESGDLAAAEQYYDVALVSLPAGDGEGYLELVWYYAGREDASRAAEALARYLLTDRDSSTAWLATGRVKEIEGHYLEAIAAFERAHALDPTSYESFYWAGHTAVRQGDWELARRYLQQAIDIQPWAWRPYELIGLSYMAEGQYEDAFAWYEQISDLPEGLLGMAKACYLEGSYEEALTYYEQALALDPSPKLYYETATAAMALARWDQARVLLDTAIALTPGVARYHLSLGDTCLQLAEPDCARAAYRTVLELEPDNQSARQALDTLPDAP